MKSTLSAVSLGLFFCSPGNSATEPEQSIQALTPPFMRFDWIGQEGVTWFIQGSDNLVDWHFYPLVDYGIEHDPLDFTSSSDKYFMRLWYTSQPLAGGTAEAMDFDGDGLPSLFEVAIFGTNPLRFDTDSGTTSDATKYENPALEASLALEVFTPFQ